MRFAAYYCTGGGVIDSCAVGDKRTDYTVVLVARLCFVEIQLVIDETEVSAAPILQPRAYSHAGRSRAHSSVQ